MAIKALQEGPAAAQRERAEALAELQTAADTIAKLRADISAAQQDKLALDAHAGQLSTESTDFKAKLSTADDNLLSVTTQLNTVNTKLSASEAALASVCTELEQKAAANAALTTANTELEERSAVTAESTALLNNKLCSVHAMLKEALPGEVSNTRNNCCSRC
jgi:chromosome segregation ATPase